MSAVEGENRLASLAVVAAWTVFLEFDIENTKPPVSCLEIRERLRSHRVTGSSSSRVVDSMGIKYEIVVILD